MESMAELDDIDDIGVTEPAIFSLNEIRRLHDSQTFKGVRPSDLDFNPAEATNKVPSRTLN